MTERILLAGVDLDGTLLREDKSLSEKTFEAIKSAKKRGIEIVPITGRPLSGVPDFIRESRYINYIITSNGAKITDLKSGKAVYRSTIPFEKSLELTRYLSTMPARFEFFADDVGYITKDTLEFHRKRFKGTPLMPYIEQSRVALESLEAFVQKGKKEADEFFVICENAECRDEIRAAAENDSELQYCEIADVYIELSHRLTDKGKALRQLCGMLDIPQKNTAAFGDGENDVKFLKEAGLSVAMGNAVPQVKALADIVTDTNENDGVAKILNQL